MTDKKHRLRIIFGDNRAEIEEHARSTIKVINEYEKKTPWKIIPRGVPYHSTLYPLRCEDCGKTHWSKDEYGPHLGCKGMPDKQTGF